VDSTCYIWLGVVGFSGPSDEKSTSPLPLRPSPSTGHPSSAPARPLVLAIAFHNGITSAKILQVVQLIRHTLLMNSLAKHRTWMHEWHLKASSHKSYSDPLLGITAERISANSTTLRFATSTHSGQRICGAMIRPGFFDQLEGGAGKSGSEWE